MKAIKSISIISLVVIIIYSNGVFAQSKTYSKELVKKEMELTTFHSIEVSGLAQVYIKQGLHPYAVIKVSGMPVDKVKVKVEGDVLMISTPGNYSGESVKIHIVYTEVDSLLVMDAAEVFSEGAIKTSTLEVTVLDAGNAKLEVDVSLLKVQMSDSADLTLSGYAKKQKILSKSKKGTLTNLGLSTLKK